MKCSTIVKCAFIWYPTRISGNIIIPSIIVKFLVPMANFPHLELSINTNILEYLKQIHKHTHTQTHTQTKQIHERYIKQHTEERKKKNVYKKSPSRFSHASFAKYYKPSIFKRIYSTIFVLFLAIRWCRMDSVCMCKKYNINNMKIFEIFVCHTVPPPPR